MASYFGVFFNACVLVFLRLWQMAKRNSFFALFCFQGRDYFAPIYSVRITGFIGFGSVVRTILVKRQWWHTPAHRSWPESRELYKGTRDWVFKGICPVTFLQLGLASCSSHHFWEQSHRLGTKTSQEPVMAEASRHSLESCLSCIAISTASQRWVLSCLQRQISVWRTSVLQTCPLLKKKTCNFCFCVVLKKVNIFPFHWTSWGKKQFYPTW